ncbi:MAG: M28 family peptidase [Proteobacteria bacterium]|nr:M28 family peptidase [Pseudomonadota bacterium]
MRAIQLMVLSLFGCLLCSNKQSYDSKLLVLDISNLKNDQVMALKSSNVVNWWVEAGDRILIQIPGSDKNELKSRNLPFSILEERVGLEKSELSVIRGAHINSASGLFKPVFKGGRALIVLKKDAARFLHAHAGHGHDVVVSDFEGSQVLAEKVRIDPNILLARSEWSAQQMLFAKEAMQLVDSDRWYADVQNLSQLNRHISSQDNIVARDFVASELKLIPGMKVELQEFSLGVSGRKAWNVIGTYDLSQSSKKAIFVTGHYDSISDSIGRGAPGAEDNATGAAGVIEMARVLSKMEINRKLVFIAFSGEEQGLLGSKHHVSELAPQEGDQIEYVINMDMIGYSKDLTYDVLLETSSKFKTISDKLATMASQTRLNVFRSYNPFGSDHMPYINRGIPAVLTIDNDWDDYVDYHKTTDRIDNVVKDMGWEILKMNVGTVAADSL